MNKVNLLGTFTKEFEYSHSTNGKDFYKSVLEVARKSEVIDHIPIIVQKPYVNMCGQKWFVDGELRVFNRHGHSHYYVYANYIYQIDESDMDYIEISGLVNNVNPSRHTPNGKIIMDVMLDVERENGVVDKIPVICWNKLAKTNLVKGQELHVEGRVQSRTYIKNGERTVIEVSANNIY